MTDDFNGAEQEGVGIYQVTQKNGERWSAARAYLLPHMTTRKNLSVETHAHVQRIIFEGSRVLSASKVAAGRTRPRVIRARREVIVAAGALQTPQLLMLSGVGDTQELSRLGIPVVQHLPGVGKNLQDHPDFIFGFRTPVASTRWASRCAAAHVCCGKSCAFAVRAVGR